MRARVAERAVARAPGLGVGSSRPSEAEEAERGVGDVDGDEYLGDAI